MNAFIQAPVTEKLWTTLGPEFGKDAGKTLKSAGAVFRSHLAKCIEFLVNESCRADPNSWLKLETRPEYEVQYYSYLLCYMDDIHCIHHNADDVLQWLHKSFALKPGFKKPDMYLSAKLHKTRSHNEVWAFAISSVKYVQVVVRN